MLVVAVTSPVLGAIADFTGSKKKFLFFYTSLACIFTGTLFFVQKGDVALGMGLFILAEIGYRSSQVFYNGLLPEIAAPEEVGRISGTGWAIGSAGGIVCLLIVLPLIVLIEGTLIVRLSLVITAVFFALSAVPIFLNLPERAKPQPLPPGETLLTIGFRRLWLTLKKARRYREFLKFMLAFLIYNDAIIMALDFAAIIGAVLFGMEQQQLIIFIIMVQGFSVIGAYIFGHMVDRRSSKQSLIVSLLLMIVAVIWLMFSFSIVGFYLIGALAGFALTGVQSVSRTMVSQLSPPGQSAEFYGLFAVTGRTSSFIGPTVYGVLAAEAAIWFTNRGETVAAAEQLGQRVAIGSILVFLLIGLGVLLSVNEARGRAAALEAGE
ncbi:MAG: MFS transporter, partial [Anaerolineae bacterium]